jgi:hypothetical protein
MAEFPSQKITFNAPGLAFGEFAPSMSEESTLHAIRTAVRRIVNSRELQDVYLAQGINDAFIEYEVPAMPFDLLGSSILSWIKRAPRPELQDFKSWMRSRYDLLDESLQRYKPELDERAIKNIAQLGKCGILSKDLVAVSESVLPDIPIGALSSFEAGERVAQAICEVNGLDVPVLRFANIFSQRQTCEQVGQRMEYCYTHEALHAVGVAGGGGFVFGIADEGQPAAMMEETSVKHFELVSREGDAETIMPSRRTGVGASYGEVRELHGLFALYGPQPFGFDLVAESYCSPRDRVTGPGNPRRELLHRLNRSATEFLPEYGDHAWLKISDKYNTLFGWKQAHFVDGIVLRVKQRIGMRIAQAQWNEHIVRVRG